MEKKIRPPRREWEKILVRPGIENDELIKICRDVFAEIRKNGDKALRKYTWFFDQVRLDTFEVSSEEWDEAEKNVDENLKLAIREAYKNIQAFHSRQLPGKVEYIDPHGFRCWQEVRGIEKVGLYIPGGSAPLFSTVLMLGIPARLAGCKEVVLCTPPDRQGKVNPAILWTAALCGIRRIFKLGGIQAIGAMSFGTETVPRVYKIFGPGNQYVMAAKQLACNYGVAIDMPAGPSEVMIVADETACPAYLAADLLSQAEHGPDSQVTLLTTDEELWTAVERELQQQLMSLPRKNIALKALQSSKFIVLESLEECMDMVNEYAPEHLILCIRDYYQYIAMIQNAGSVFLGNYSPESAGDYASGTNHTLPTNGFAKAYSGVNTDAFMKKITFQEIDLKGLEYLAPAIQEMAAHEGLDAHLKAVGIRLDGNF